MSGGPGGGPSGGTSGRASGREGAGGRASGGHARLTPFGEILRRAVLATPGAVGGAFADAQGEMVDSFSDYDAHEWAVLTAHYGVVLAQLDAWLGTRHFGGPEYFIAQHASLDVLVHAVPGGYYALLAIAKPTPTLGFALVHLREAARALCEEMS